MCRILIPPHPFARANRPFTLNRRGCISGDDDSVRQITDTALKAVALAMGIATAVLSFMGNLPERDGLSMLGIGLTCIAIHGFVFKGEK